MRIHWYWPFSYGSGRSPLVEAATNEGDQVVVQALSSRFGEKLHASGPHEIVRNLPESNAKPHHTNLIRRLPSRALIYPQRAWARDRVLRRGSFDVSCIFHLNHYVDSAALRLLPSRTAMVSFVHDVVPHEPRFPVKIERALLRSTYGSAGHMVVYHGSLRQRLVDEFDVDPDMVHVVPIPIGRRVVSAAILPEGPCSFLFFGGFRANKGLDVLLDAVESLGPTDQFVVHIAGSGHGALAARTRGLAERFPHVTCEIGFISADRKDELFRTSDILVLPYTAFASQSAVLGDAYAYGVPIIATDVGAIGPTVRSDGTGLVIRPGDSDDLARALQSLSASEELRQRAGDAVLIAAQSHEFGEVGRRLREVFEVAATTAGP